MSLLDDVAPEKMRTDETSLPKMIYQDLRGITEKTFGLPKKLWVFIVIGFLIYIMASDGVFMSESGYIYLYDNVLTSKLDVYKKPGIHFKVPFSSVTRYKQVWIVDFGTGYAGEQIRTRKKSITLRFADSYTAKIPATFRYKLPTATDRLEMIHRDFTTQEKLVDALLIPISRNLMVSTATQYTGEEFIQGGLNQFRDSLEDQLQYGIYKTERKQFVKQRDFGTIGSQEGGSKTITLNVWKTVPVRDENGQIERLKKKSLVDYGIEVIQVTMGVPVPDTDLEQLLADKKRFDRVASEKAEELALEKDDEKLKLAKLAKETKILLERKAEELAIFQEEQKLRLEKKAADIAIFQEEQKLRLERKAAELALEKEDEKIKLARKNKELAVDIATTKSKKEEELIIAQENEKIRLAQKAEALALEIEDTKIQLAKQSKLEKLRLAQKAEELAVSQKQLEIVQAQLKIQKMQEEEELAIAVGLAKRKNDEELAIALTTTKVKKEEELIIAKANLAIQQANFEAAQFEVKARKDKGLAEAEILKAMYDARRPEIYKAEMQREIAAIIYPNLKGVQLTMPHNIINLGETGKPLQTNLDVLSNFATIGMMEGLEKKALAGSCPKP